jgi:hypothetical protein
MNTIAIGELAVNRLGFGAMRVCGPQVWGPPARYFLNRKFATSKSCIT